MKSLKHLLHPDSTALQQLREREMFLSRAVWLSMVWIKMHLLSANSGDTGRGSRSFLGKDPSKEIHPGLMLLGQNAAAWEREVRSWDF